MLALTSGVAIDAISGGWQPESDALDAFPRRLGMAARTPRRRTVVAAVGCGAAFALASGVGGCAHHGSYGWHSGSYSYGHHRPHHGGSHRAGGHLHGSDPVVGGFLLGAGLGYILAESCD